MNRTDYLADAHVSAFSEWLAHALVRQEFDLAVAPSRFVPGGIDRTVTGAEGALGEFMWRSRWTCPDDGVSIEPGDWASTHDTLERLKRGLESAMEEGDESRTFGYCRAILEWGGVRGAVPFLMEKRNAGNLIDYLRDVAPLFRLDDPGRSLDTIDDTRIERFDAGLTKIHSILDDSGSPIYDSRVGATTSMFVALYCRENGLERPPATLRFPSGAARGRQLRNPRDFDLPAAPALYTTYGGAAWAQCMVRLGWIMDEVIDRAGLFADRMSSRERLVALQGAFFMLGYDLRAFRCPPAGNAAVPIEAPPHAAEADEALDLYGVLGNCVPTGFSMDRVVALYGSFLEGGHGLPDTRQGFIDWQTRHGGVANRYTAAANCYPLSVSEFDLFGADHARREEFLRGGPDGLTAVLGGRTPAADERDLVCLIDCYLAGSLAALDRSGRKRRLVTEGIAGTGNAADLVLSVGCSVGRHFGLIGPDGAPTAEFHRFFGGPGPVSGHPLDSALPPAA